MLPRCMTFAQKALSSTEVKYELLVSLMCWSNTLEGGRSPVSCAVYVMVDMNGRNAPGWSLAATAENIVLNSSETEVYQASTSILQRDT